MVHSSELYLLISLAFVKKQGRKGQLDMPKRMILIERREREREKER